MTQKCGLVRRTIFATALIVCGIIPCAADGIDLSGTWEFGSGGESWIFSPLGNNRYSAVEKGFGNSSGTATVSGRSFRLDFTYAGGSGYFEGTIAPDGMTIQTIRHFDEKAFTFRRIMMPGDHAVLPPSAAKPAPPASDLSGRWRFGPKGEYWTLTRMPDGQYRAQESGFGNASGIATVSGNDFRLEFTFGGGSGYFVGKLSSDRRTIQTIRHHDMVPFTFEYLGPAGDSDDAASAKKPQAPGTGRFSVQAIYGGRDIIPLCIVPPRQYTNGAAIPRGTPCEIVVLQSKQAGRPGTYSEIVGRDQGVVTSPDDLEPWINLSARVPIGNAEYGTIYLACYAVIGGLKSDPTNRFLTISWYPGGFSAEEFPPTEPIEPDGVAPEANAPPNTSYPDWVRNPRLAPQLTSSFSSALGRPAEGFKVSADPRMEKQRKLYHSGTVSMRVGETHTFIMRDPTDFIDKEKGEILPGGFNGKIIGPGGDVGIFVSPATVLSRHGTTVTAVGEGVGEVWMRRTIDIEMLNGTRGSCEQRNYYVVLVGQGALDYYQHPGRASSVLPGPPGPPLARVILYGRAVRSGSLQPVPGAKVTLVNMKTGKGYTRDDWTTGSDGTFTIAAHQLLPAGRYEVLPQRFSGGGLGPERDLWTVRQYQIEIKEGRTLVDCGDKLEMNELQYIPFRNR